MANVKDLIVKIGAKTTDLNKGINKAEGKIKGFGKVVGRIGGLIAGAFAVSKIIGFVQEASKAAGVIEGVEQAFKRIADPTLLDNLRKATNNTVNDLELMKKAVQANNFRIPVKDLGHLFEFAHMRAKQTGEAVDYLVNSIVLGIGRKSPLILDNLGISAIRLREELKGAGSEVSTVGDVAAAMGRIAQEEIEKAGTITETTNEKVMQMAASWENVKVEVGKFVNMLKKEYAPYVLEMLGAVKNFLTPEDARIALENFKKFGEVSDYLNKNKEEQLRLLDEEKKKVEGLIARQKGNLKVLIADYEYLDSIKSKSNKKEIIAAENTIKLQEKYISAREKQLSIIIEEEGRIQRIVDTEAQTPGLIADLKTQIKGLEDLLPLAGTEKQIYNINKELSKAKKELNRLQGLGKDINPPKDIEQKIELRTEEDLFPEESLKSLMETPLDLTELEDTYKAADKAIDKHVEKLNDLQETYLEAQWAVSDFFYNLLTLNQQGIKSIGDFIKYALAAAQRFIASKLAEGMAESFVKGLRSSKNPYIGLAVGGSAAAKVKSYWGSIPRFANEGFVKGNNSLIMANDYPGANQDPEGVFKASTLKNLANRSSRVDVNVKDIKIKGTDIVIAFKRGEEMLNYMT